MLPVAAVDLLLVVIFCAIGRRSHDEAILAGMARTLWPFATGLAAGWVIVVARRLDPVRVWPAGVIVWLSAVLGGMVLRAVSGQGLAPSFVAVAAVVLAVFLGGWRAGYVWSARLRRGPGPGGE